MLGGGGETEMQGRRGLVGEREREREGGRGKRDAYLSVLQKNGLKINGFINGRLTVNGIEVPLDHTMIT